MPTLRILHASDLHISLFKNMVSSVDHFSNLRDQQNLNFWTLSKLAAEFFRSFRKKMTASSYDPVVLKRFAHFVYNHSRTKFVDGAVSIEKEPTKVDAVILTGDLATTGSPHDIERVSSFLSSPFDARYPYLNNNHEATLSAIQDPIWFFPGNHDRFVPTLSWIWINHLPFPKFFEPGGIQFDTQLLNFRSEPVRVLDGLSASDNLATLRVVVIAADFSLKRLGDHDGIYGWLAQGRVYENVLGELVKKTQEQISKHKAENTGTLCVLWAIHFPPGFPHISPTNRLLMEEQLIAQAKQNGVEAILAGHTHEQTSYRKPAMSSDVLCCGSTSQRVPSNSRGANRFQIIDISTQGAGVHIDVENYKYKRAGEDGVSIAHFYKEA